MDVPLDPACDDLPLMANTSHILVKHYVLDLDVDFQRHIIEGTIVLFFESADRLGEESSSTEEARPGPGTDAGTFSSTVGCSDFAICGEGAKDTSGKGGNHDNWTPASGISSSKRRCDPGDHGSEDFVLVLDCCDLSVLQVEAVDVAAAPGTEAGTRPSGLAAGSRLRRRIVRELLGLPADRWREQLDGLARCSRAPGCGELLFDTDAWSLQVRKSGARTAADFPPAVRIRYRTQPQGQSVTWTSDQSGRPCVYTAGSPVNNRALFPCQEPPVAMATWQATVRAAASLVVLMSGENAATPTQVQEGRRSWHYYVTMPMPASTFTVAVGSWMEVRPETCATDDVVAERGPSSPPDAERRCVGVCGHVDFPCRFRDASAPAQAVLPYRVFAPASLRGACHETLLWLLPACLSAAHSVLGTHPFSRLDVLIVPANFSSLGMASPHLVFLSQSALAGRSPLCGSRLCHEIAHAWFGLAIGARDWTEEWLSEGFATHLEDVFWARAQQLAPHEARERQELRACLRWRRLQDEARISPDEMQVLRPNKEKTGHTSDSGSSVIRHGLNPEKAFLQVHYLKGYFLLRFLAGRLGDDAYFSFLRKFVQTFHGQLILSQDFLQMLLENIPEEKRLDLSVQSVFRDWLESPGIPQPLQTERQAGAECELARQVGAEVAKWNRLNRRPRKRKRRGTEEVFEKLLPDQLVLLLEHLLEQKTLHPRTLRSLEKTYDLPQQDAEVRHRWCELVVKHRYTRAYGDVEHFLREDQAMGVYLYGELMVGEDARQQQLARRCFALTQEQMDRGAARVVAAMLF